ncbi:MAG: hypothetical protein PVF80_12025 [Gammaproteobacteria bacterium]|jgi:hypothetical protein
MAKGFARLGIFPALLLINQVVRAVTASDLSITEIAADPLPAADWRELFKPIAEPIDLRDITSGDHRGRQRMETDLLIIPERFLKLACSGPMTGRTEKFFRIMSGDAIPLRTRPRTFDLSAAC